MKTGQLLALMVVSFCSTCQAWLFFSETDHYGPICDMTFSSKKPFDNAKKRIPQKEHELGFYLQLFTWNTWVYGEYIDMTNVAYTNFDASRPTYIIIHGYRDNAQSGWVWDMETQLMYKENCNVIRVNWKDGADSFSYDQAAANTRLVGCLVFRFLQHLHDYFGLNYDDVHLIGHSLGAHTCGYVGMLLKQETGFQIGKITGLDMAGPSFDEDSVAVRLDASDAKFVQCIHTDGQHLLVGGFGYMRDGCHVDMYPCGGHDQEGCPPHPGKAVWDYITGNAGLGEGLACSHNRVRELFTESILKCVFKAVKCSSYDAIGSCSCENDGCTNMGFNIDTTARGNYYLHPVSSYPYESDQPN